MQIRDVRLSPKSGHHLQLRGSPEDRHTAMLLWRLCTTIHLVNCFGLSQVEAMMVCYCG